MEGRRRRKWKTRGQRKKGRGEEWKDEERTARREEGRDRER